MQNLSIQKLQAHRGSLSIPGTVQYTTSQLTGVASHATIRQGATWNCNSHVASRPWSSLNRSATCSRLAHLPTCRLDRALDLLPQMGECTIQTAMDSQIEKQTAHTAFRYQSLLLARVAIASGAELTETVQEVVQPWQERGIILHEKQQHGECDLKQSC